MVINQTDVRKRLESVRNEVKLSSHAFAVECGLDPSSYSKQIKGQVNVTDRVIMLISKRFGINAQWLADGVGEMMKKDTALSRFNNTTASQYNSGNAHGNMQNVTTPDASSKAIEDNIALLKKIIEDKDKEIAFLREMLLRQCVQK